MSAAPPGSPPAPAAPPDRLLLHLDSFEGPLDLLLDLARAQKIDLARISVLTLAEQFLAVIEGARAIRLTLAADWLVMAAWIAWLKSRLLLPPEDAAAEEAGEDAARLAERLADLERIRGLARWLDARPVLGRDVFRRGGAEDLTVVDRSRLRLDLASLVASYLAAARRRAAGRRFVPTRLVFWTVADALHRIGRILGSARDWTALDRLLPAEADPDHAADEAGDGLGRRASIASTLIAGLELARRGDCEIRQDTAFAPVLLRRREAA